MGRLLRHGAILAALLPVAAFSPAALAADPSVPPPIAPSCTVRAEPTGPLAPWSRPIPFSVAGDIAQLPATALPIGRAVDVALLPTPRVRFRVRPEKPGGPVTYGGMIAFNIRQAGTYRVALGSPAWVDMISGGSAVASVAHGHGPVCTTIHKMVDFPLTPGRYTLQISGNATLRTKALVVRLP